MPEFATDLARASAIVREAGRRAIREIRQGLSVDRKGHDDVVTNIDVSIEKYLRDELTRAFPGDTLIGEELGGTPGHGRQWLIDPVDGTLNLARGVPLSSVSLALQIASRSVVGVVYDPYRDELFCAERGGGARLNDAPLAVAHTSSLSDAMIAAKPAADSLAPFTRVAQACRDVRRLGTAAIELAYVAAGRLDGFLEFGLKAWDTAAGVLLVEEGGGQVTDARGAPYIPGAPSTVASNGRIHPALLECVAG